MDYKKNKNFKLTNKSFFMCFVCFTSIAENTIFWGSIGKRNFCINWIYLSWIGVEKNKMHSRHKKINYLIIWITFYANYLGGLVGVVSWGCFYNKKNYVWGGRTIIDKFSDFNSTVMGVLEIWVHCGGRKGI